MTLAYLTHSDCLRHDMGPGHPESAERLRAIDRHLRQCGLAARLVHHQSPEVSDDQLLAVHDRRHLESLAANSPQQGLTWLDPDTAMNRYSLAAARRAAGAAVRAVDLLLQSEATQAFCAVRPPGHHAERDRAMGFCLFNNVVVAARHAIDRYRLQRVAIVDFDVHHGNGTEQQVAGDPRILYCSSFQHPFYPYSDAASDAENIIKAPLPAGADGTAFRRVVGDQFLPRLATFAPQLVLVSAGFDAHRDDPLAQLNLLEDDYAWVTARLRDQARRSAAGRILSTLEGGYQPAALARCVAAHLNALLATEGD
jgi:acetoin utilization deacetylase AcuC-like enzyme